MGRKKAIRTEEVKELTNVIKIDNEIFVKNFNINNEIPLKKAKILLELGCGKAEYSLALAQNNNQSIIIGVDLKADRIWHAAKEALKKNIDNLFFVITKIENIDKIFQKSQIDEIWLTFPDPHPKKRNSKKRLTADENLERIKKILKKNGIIHIKTDNIDLMDFTIQNMNKLGFETKKIINNIYSKDDLPEILKIKTTFEKKYLSQNKEIHYGYFQK